MSPDFALRGVAGLLTISVALVAYEFSLLMRSGQLTEGGLFDWRIMRLRRSVVNGKALRPLDIVFQKRGLTALWLAAIPTTAAVSVVGWGSLPGLVSAALLAAFLLVTALRFPIGRDGADQLALFLAFAVLAYQVHPSTKAAKVGLLLICAQLTTAYLVSGLSKFTSREWRGGDAMHAILRTSCYGNPPLADLITPRQARLLGISVATLETSFPLVWVAGTRTGIALIAACLAFHLGTWLVMGLNSFFITFSAGYPALIWLAVS